MPRLSIDPPGLADVLRQQDGVVGTASARRWMSRQELRWRVTSGRWQRPCHGIVVAHSGPITRKQRLWVAVLWGGEGAVLAGLTAAKLDGLEGFSRSGFADRPIHLLVPACRSIGRKPPPGISVSVHYSTAMTPDDVHPRREPRRTRVARSLVDAAAWMGSDRGAQAVLAAGVQQRLARGRATCWRSWPANRRLPRRAMISATLDDIAGGAQALSELDLIRLVRCHRLPEPDRQARRRDCARAPPVAGRRLGDGQAHRRGGRNPPHRRGSVLGGHGPRQRFHPGRLSRPALPGVRRAVPPGLRGRADPRRAGPRSAAEGGRRGRRSEARRIEIPA